MVATPTNPYDIFSTDAQRNSILHDHMRLHDPVHLAIHPVTGQHVWFLTRYNDGVRFLKDKRFGRDPARLSEAVRGANNYAVSADIINRHMLNLDDPDHARLRSIVHLAFLPQRIQTLRPRLETIANDLFDQIDATVAGGDEIDLTQAYISQFPLLAVIEMLGLPHDDYEQLYRWTHAMLSENAIHVHHTIEQFSRYLSQQIVHRETHHVMTDDLLSVLLLSESQGQKISREELLAMVYLFMTAGYETMVNFISNSVVTMLEVPDILYKLKDNLDSPAVIKATIEEFLRFNGPSHITLEARAYEDVIWGDKLIRQGDCVHVVLHAVNRDPDIFPNPHTFDALRHPNKHIAFSHGIHHCLGSALARLEADIALVTLVRRVPNL